MEKLSDYDTAFKKIHDALEKNYDKQFDRLKDRMLKDANFEDGGDVEKVIRAYLYRWHLQYYTDLTKLPNEKILNYSNQLVSGGKINIGHMDKDLDAIEKQLDKVKDYWTRAVTEDNPEWNRRVYQNEGWAKTTQDLQFPEGYYTKKFKGVCQLPDWGKGIPAKTGKTGLQDEAKTETAENAKEEQEFLQELNPREAWRAALTTHLILLDPSLQGKSSEELGKALDNIITQNDRTNLIDIAKRCRFEKYPTYFLFQNWDKIDWKSKYIPILKAETELMQKAVKKIEDKMKEKKEGNLNLESLAYVKSVEVSKEKDVNELIIKINGNNAKGADMKPIEYKVDLSKVPPLNFKMGYNSTDLAFQLNQVIPSLVLSKIVTNPAVLKQIAFINNGINNYLKLASPQVNIVGYASWDGSGNTQLALNRAKKMQQALKSRFPNLNIGKPDSKIVDCEGKDTTDNADAAWTKLLEKWNATIKEPAKKLNNAQIQQKLKEYNNNKLKGDELAFFDDNVGKWRGATIKVLPPKDAAFTKKFENPVASPGPQLVASTDIAMGRKKLTI
jgi:hypothetical protein